MAKDKLTIFDEPEKVDAMVNTRLKQFPAKGGRHPSRNVGWSDEELEIMDGVIWDYLTTQGLSREQTAKQLHSRWDITIGTARTYITDAIKRMAKHFPDDDMETKREMFLERCQSILQDAIDSGQKSEALKALDIYAKASGFYKEQKDINLTGENTIHFDFQ